MPILVVDDDRGIRNLLTTILEDAGYEVVTAGDGQAALPIVDHQPLSLIVVDVWMPFMNGLELCSALDAQGQRVPRVVMTGLGAAKFARTVGAVGYLDKPFTVFQALATIETALQPSSLAPLPVEAIEQDRALRVFILTKQRFLAEMMKATLDHGVYLDRVDDDVTQAGEIIRDWQPHLAVVDLDLGGIKLLRQLGTSCFGGARRIPILAVTRHADLNRRLAAFDAGADDVMSYPLSPEELLARVRVITRRRSVEFPPVEPVLKVGDLEMDILRRTARIGSTLLNLSGMERSLLYLLAANAGEAVTRDEILEALWGADHVEETDVVGQHVDTLQAKLASLGAGARIITRVPGREYLFLDEGTRRPDPDYSVQRDRGDLPLLHH